MRFFAATVENYEAMRAALDEALGFPNPSTGTLTALPPAAESLIATDGRVLLAATDEQCGSEWIAPVLAQGLAAGIVAELTEAEFQGLRPAPPQIEV